ncbi:MAG: hypothetical protein WCL54_07945 [Clostridia bacterium]
MIKKENIYWLGGSPCSGKSTIAEFLVRDYGFRYYKCDDHLDEYIERGVEEDIPIMKRLKAFTTDEMWLRDVDEQVQISIDYFLATFHMILEDIQNLDQKVIVEGAAIMPIHAKNFAIDPTRYVCIVPSRAFQLEKYAARTWAYDRLMDSSDPHQCFKNWMERDCRFAERVKKDAVAFGFHTIEVDGNQSIDENYQFVKNYFDL